MTNYDRSKLARIVAVILDRNGTEEYARAQLEQYAPGASDAELNRAILEGSEGRAVAQFMSEERELAAQDILDRQRHAGAIGQHVLVRFTVRRGEEEAIRSATTTVFGAADPELIRDAADAAAASAVAENRQRDTNNPEGTAVLVPGSIEYIFVAPLFAEG